MSEGGCYRHSIAPLQLCALPLQVPTVTGIGQDAALLYEAESEEVVVARDTFASLRQYLVTLQDEVPSPLPTCVHSQTQHSEIQERLPPSMYTSEAVGGIGCMARDGEVVASQPQSKK